MNLMQEVQEYLEYCRFRKELDEKTVKAYRIDLKQFTAFAGNDFPQRSQIETYITNLHRQFGQKTVKRKIASIKAFFSYLEEMEKLDIPNPFHKIKSRFKEVSVLPRIIPRETIERLLNYMYQEMGLQKSKNILRDLTVIELFFATGARVYEISNLKTEGIDLSSGVIRIMGKGKKERYIQIGDEEVGELVRSYYKENKDEIDRQEYFFVNNRGGRYTEQSIRLMLEKYSARAGITQHITPHMFRHSLATYLIEEGADISCVQKILGHSSIKTTQIYVYVAAKQQAEILKNLHPRNKMRIDRGI